MTALENGLERKKINISYNNLERWVFVCSLKNTCPKEETLMIRLENVLDRKKRVYVSYWEDVGVLQEEFKIEQRTDKWKVL